MGQCDLFSINFASCVSILFMLVFLRVNASLKVSIRRSFAILVLLELLELVAYSLEAWTATFAEPTVFRILFSAIGYSIRPVLLYLLLCLHIRKDVGKRGKVLLLLPAVLNIAAAFSALFTDIVYSYSASNTFVRGPFGYAAYVAAGFYLVLLLITTVASTYRENRLESLIIVADVLFITVSIVLEMMDSAESIGRIAITLSTIFYYMYFQTQEYRARMDETQRDLEDTLEGAKTGIWTIELADGEEPRMYADKTMRKLLGAPDGIGPEACYRAWYDNIVPEDLDSVLASVDEMIEKGRSENEYQWVHPVYGQIYVRCGGALNRHYVKHGTCLRGYHQDITEIVEREQEQLDIVKAISGSFASLLYIDIAEDSYKLFGSARHLQDITEQDGSAQEVLHRMCRSMIEPSYADDMLKFVELSTIAGRLGDTAAIRCEYQEKESGWCSAGFIVARRDDTGRATRVVFVTQLIDEEKRKELDAQAALKDAFEAADRANRAKTEFMSQMSHDIRTPMNAIIGMTALAMAHLDDRERVADSLTKITTSSRHLLGLINEVLDMSKIESGKVSLTEEEFNLSDLLNNLVAMIQPDILRHKHELKVHIHDMEHEDVIGDSLRIQQVFVNLMSNAVKYTPDGGKICMTVSEKPGGRSMVSCYEFIFEDNGMGMSEEYLEHLYEPFYRSEDTRINKIQGTGLGLPIARNIVQMLDGDIQVESKAGIGTKFTVTIYLKLQERQRADSEEFLALPVLVVDDDQLTCESVCKTLNEMGMDSEWVLSAEEAVGRVGERHRSKDDYYAVILDWDMPEMDGIEAARSIRRNSGDSESVIILAAYDWSQIEMEARAAGVDAFINKPVFKSGLIQLFKKLTNNTKNVDPEEDLLAAVRDVDYSDKRILLVEDNELNREIISEILGIVGMQIETAENGRIAVDMFAESEVGYYDLILMDIQMPVMNGYEATYAIRALQRPDANHIPIMAMTANAFAEDVQAAKSAGMNEHIAKPIDLEVLMQAIGRWVS